MVSEVPRRDVPVPSEAGEGVWGSDAIADVIRALGIPYVLVNPGASFRGLHDSLVNHLGNERPQMLLVLHEEHAVAIAHGYAKVAGRPLAAILHSNVGLMHGSMAIFDAWADRVPVLVLGATGPMDAARRRPWIDWLHTAQDQGALVRHFVKWDALPGSVPAAQEALLRAYRIAETAPRGPVYVCLDAAIQESRLPQRPEVPDVERYRPPQPVVASALALEQAAEWLRAARVPVVLAGRVSRLQAGWDARVQLAEALGARVITDLKVGSAFPTRHALHAGPAGMFLAQPCADILRRADVVLSLDWVDLGGTLKQAWGDAPVQARIIQVSMDHQLHNGWSMDHQSLAPVDLHLACEPEPVVDALNTLLRDVRGARPEAATPEPAFASPSPSDRGDLRVADVAAVLRQHVAPGDVTLLRLPLSWSGEMWDFEGPLDYLGFDGGGGIGSGPGMAVGGALALKDSTRLPVAILGDGDFLMGVTALWTGANARLPLLIIVVNNRSFFNDELHQERVARERGRPVANRWIGQRIDDPAPDLAQLAKAQGLVGIGPVSDRQRLDHALAEALAQVRAGRGVVIDVHVTPGYAPAMSQGMTRTPGSAS
jgi:thiamine pyrophosphate-dependent acetolactate synthase large subunit-like protein